MAGDDSTKARLRRAELRHPFFDNANPPSSLDCRDALDRAACVVELFNHLKLGGDVDGLSPKAASGYIWLSETLRETLSYASHRLSSLSQERAKTDGERARYLSALLKSLTVLNTPDRDCVLNDMAARLQITRGDVDAFIDRARTD